MPAICWRNLYPTRCSTSVFTRTFSQKARMEEPRRRVMEHCMALVPTARVMRTHGLYQSTNMFHFICDTYPQIVADCSLFLPYSRNLEPALHYFGRQNRKLVRLPTFFSDDVAWRWPRWRYSMALLDEPGLKIFCFHPIHVALNSSDPWPYENLKASLDTPLYSTARSRVDRYCTGGSGPASSSNACCKP